ncbi:MAG: chemotaxis protein CheW [Steroidobacteraceae bacterium]|jgi:purine-binding chemotaxis protein CheW
MTAQPQGEQSASASAMWRDCLTFRLRNEEYGIDLLCVREIRTYERPNWIAGAPDYLPGVLNMRGDIVPIMDLRLRFGLEAEFSAHTVTIVVNISGVTAGLVVDSVSDVLQLSAEQIKAAPDFRSTVDARFVTRLGLVREDQRERTLILLDVERLLASAQEAGRLN